MERNIGLLRINTEDSDSREEHDDPKCGECGKPYERALLATVSSNGLTQTYYACPRCLSKVSEPKHHEHEEHARATSATKTPKRSELKPADNETCRHFLGYLKGRPRDTAFPDECLTCSNMVECLVK